MPNGADLAQSSTLSSTRDSMESAMVKYKASTLLRQITEEALQLHGAYGYMVDSSVQRSFRDSRAASIAGGTDETMLYHISQYATHNK